MVTKEIGAKRLGKERLPEQLENINIPELFEAGLGTLNKKSYRS